MPRLDPSLDRRFKYPPTFKDDIFKAREKGWTFRAIATEFGVSEAYVRKICTPEKFKQYPITKEKAQEYQKRHREYKKQLVAEWKIDTV